LQRVKIGEAEPRENFRRQNEQRKAWRMRMMRDDVVAPQRAHEESLVRIPRTARQSEPARDRHERADEPRRELLPRTHPSILARGSRHRSRRNRTDMPGKPVRRRWHLDLHGIRREGSKESGFSYLHPDGRRVEDEKTLARIAKLRVPPAWRDVRIARGDSAPLQAVGVDKKGRVQYRY